MENSFDQNVIKMTCPHCGASVVRDICPYCGSRLKIDSESIARDYPIVDCCEATISGVFSLYIIFALAFSFAGIVVPIVWFVCSGVGGWSPFQGSVVIFFVPFAAIGIAFSIKCYKTVKAVLLVRSKGVEIKGKVTGYHNDTIYINDYPAQIVEILSQTKEGPRVLSYQLGKVEKPYAIGSDLTLKVYQNMYAIVNK